MIGAKLDGEAQRKKLISTRHPKQAPTRSILVPAKARRRKRSSERRRARLCRLPEHRRARLCRLPEQEGGEYP